MTNSLVAGNFFPADLMGAPSMTIKAFCGEVRDYLRSSAQGKSQGFSSALVASLAIRPSRVPHFAREIFGARRSQCEQPFAFPPPKGGREGEGLFDLVTALEINRLRDLS